jgi:hypothetical protein
MDLPDGKHVLLQPGVNLENEAEIVLFRVDALLRLRDADRMLQGHPCLDLSSGDWEIVNIGQTRVDKIIQWTRRDRLLKCRLNAGASIRITYAKRREWLRYITDEDYLWIQAICDGSFYHVQQVECRAAIGRLWQAVAEVAGAVTARKPKRTKKARKAAKRKRLQEDR